MEFPKKFAMVPVAELIPYAKNSRIHSAEQIERLRASMREYGFMSPVLIDAEKNIIAGHGRVIAASAEGVEQVPCVLVDHLSDAQRRAYIVADNKLAEMGSWDNSLLEIELSELGALGIDLAALGIAELKAPQIEELPPVEEKKSRVKITATYTCPECGHVFTPGKD